MMAKISDPLQIFFLAQQSFQVLKDNKDHPERKTNNFQYQCWTEQVMPPNQLHAKNDSFYVKKGI